MNKVKRNPGRFETFELFSTLTEDLGLKIGDSNIVKKISEVFETAISNSATNDIMLYGKRNEGLFSYIVRGLNNVKLIKQEDSGDAYTVLNDDVKIPDFRIILENGKVVLIEVKNYNGDPLEYVFKLKKKYVESLKRYSDLNNVELYVAIFYRRINRFVLLSINAFLIDDSFYFIDLFEALKNNKMSILGDYKIGLPGPLEIHMKLDSKLLDKNDISKNYDVKIREMDFICNGVKINDDIGKSIAFKLMLHGDWFESEKYVIDNNDYLSEIHLKYVPEGFDDKKSEIYGITELSVLLIKSFTRKTTENKKLIKLTHSGMTLDLEKMIPSDYQSEELPIYRVYLE